MGRNPRGAAHAYVIKRCEGSKVTAFQYDKKPGDTDGDNRNNVWHVTTP
jgi:predicted lipoprotein with Yx(FWY)xxD motif